MAADLGGCVWKAFLQHEGEVCTQGVGAESHRVAGWQARGVSGVAESERIAQASRLGGTVALTNRIRVALTNTVALTNANAVGRDDGGMAGFVLGALREGLKERCVKV